MVEIFEIIDPTRLWCFPRTRPVQTVHQDVTQAERMVKYFFKTQGGSMGLAEFRKSQRIKLAAAGRIEGGELERRTWPRS
jgi:hypothetical protein